MGKTALAINIAECTLQKQTGQLKNIGTVRYLNFETTSENFLIRLIM